MGVTHCQPASHDRYYNHTLGCTRAPAKAFACFICVCMTVALLLAYSGAGVSTTVILG